MKKFKYLKSFNEAVDNPFDDDYEETNNVIEPTSFDEQEFNSEEEEEIVKEPISFEEAKAWILENYDEVKVTDMLDETRLKYVDYKQMQEEGYESEYDYYLDYGRGEAESDVVEDIVSELERKFDLDFNKQGDETNIYEFIRNIFDCLQY